MLVIIMTRPQNPISQRITATSVLKNTICKTLTWDNSRIILYLKVRADSKIMIN